MKGAHLPAIVYAIFGFSLGCLAIARLVGNPLTLYAEQRSEKLELLSKHLDDSCSAAFGSSHIHNGFDPRVFDETLGLHSIPSHSLNLAIEGGSQTEQFVMAKLFLSQLQRTRAGRDCLIMLELNAGANLQTRHLVHPRSINIYDASTAEVSLQFSDTGLSLLRRLGRASFAFAATSMHYLNVGMLESRVLPRQTKRDLLDRESDFDRRGLLIEPPNVADAMIVNEKFRSRPPAPRIVRVALMPGPRILVSKLEQAPGGHGVSYILIVAPKLSDLVSFEEYPDCVVVGDARIDVINVARPPDFPSLYQPELWHDDAHLNEAGATVYTRLIAEDISRRKAQPQVSGECGGPAAKGPVKTATTYAALTTADVG